MLPLPRLDMSTTRLAAGLIMTPKANRTVLRNMLIKQKFTTLINRCMCVHGTYDALGTDQHLSHHSELALLVVGMSGKQLLVPQPANYPDHKSSRHSKHKQRHTPCRDSPTPL